MLAWSWCKKICEFGKAWWKVLCMNSKVMCVYIYKGRVVPDVQMLSKVEKRISIYIHNTEILVSG